MDSDQLKILTDSFDKLTKKVEDLTDAIAGDGMAGKPGIATNQIRLMTDIYGLPDDRENSVLHRLSTLEDSKKEAIWKWAGAKFVIVAACGAASAVGTFLASWLSHPK